MTYSMPFPIPVLTTERQILREPREMDFAAMFAFNDSPRSAFVGRIGVICHDGWPGPELGWHLFSEGKGYANEAALAAKAVSTRVEMEGRRQEDAKKTLERGL